MDLDSYFSGIMEGFLLIQAIGSLIGLFGLSFGFLMLLLGGRSFRGKAINIVLVGILLVLISI